LNLTKPEDVFLYAVVVPVIPFAIETRAGVPSNEVQHWVSVLLAVYGATLLVASPICGVLADRIKSRQIPLLGGLLVLGGATVLFCLGRSIAVLVAARLLQGASAGVVWTVSLALLSDSIDAREAGQAMGFVAASYSIGTLISPMLGGIVYREGGYYEVFSMMFSLIGLDLILRLLLIEKHKARKWQTESATLTRAPAVEEEGSGATCTGAEREHVAIDPSTQTRGLPVIVVLMKSRRLQAAFVGTFVASTTMAAMDATLPLFVSSKLIQRKRCC
jgi:MFS family permease